MKFVVVVGCIAVGANDIERSFQTGQIRPPITAFGHFSPAMKLLVFHFVRHRLKRVKALPVTSINLQKLEGNLQ